MARKPRLFDPRTGYRIDIARHRALLRYSARKIAQYDALADEAHDHGLRLKQRTAQVAWSKRQHRYEARLKDWRQFKRILEDQVKARVEYEAKFAYTGKMKENERDRANLNIRMRYVGRLPLPTDREVKTAFYNLLLAGKGPKGWEFAVIDWRNDRKSDQGWRRGSWRGGGAHPDVRGVGPLQDERTDAAFVDWAGDMVVHSTLEDFTTLVIGEVEE
jgi:hypothetical protein